MLDLSTRTFGEIQGGDSLGILDCKLEQGPTFGPFSLIVLRV